MVGDFSINGLSNSRNSKVKTFIYFKEEAKKKKLIKKFLLFKKKRKKLCGG